MGDYCNAGINKSRIRRQSCGARVFRIININEPNEMDLNVNKLKPNTYINQKNKNIRNEQRNIQQKSNLDKLYDNTENKYSNYNQININFSNYSRPQIDKININNYSKLNSCSQNNGVINNNIHNLNMPKNDYNYFNKQSNYGKLNDDNQNFTAHQNSNYPHDNTSKYDKLNNHKTNNYQIVPKYDYEVTDELFYFNQSFYNHHYIPPDTHIANFPIEKFGLINVGNSCYMNSFLQIFFHLPNLISFLRMKFQEMSTKDEILLNLLKLAEYPFNVSVYRQLKNALKGINPQYSEYYAGDSQHFGIDLINYLINIIKFNSKTSLLNNDYDQEEPIQNNLDKNQIYVEYVKKYRSNSCYLEQLFLFNELEVICNSEEVKNMQIFSHLNISLIFPKNRGYSITLDDLLENKYMNKSRPIKPNAIITKKKIISFPQILIISLNRSTIDEEIINTNVYFKEELDLKNYIDEDFINLKESTTNFKLFAINQCYHKTRRNSHYSCYINLKHKWYYFDDSELVQEKTPNLYSTSVVGLYYVKV